MKTETPTPAELVVRSAAELTEIRLALGWRKHQVGYSLEHMAAGPDRDRLDASLDTVRGLLERLPKGTA